MDEVRRQDAGLMTINTVARRNWPPGQDPSHTTWCEPIQDQARITTAVSWVLSHPEVTGIPTDGDVRLLGPQLRAERNRISAVEAADQLAGDEAYASPFVAMPF